MLLKYLLNKKYREDYSRDTSLRFKKSDEKIEKIYSNLASEFKKNSSAKVKKNS